MIKGLKGTIRPFFKKVLIENANQLTVNNKTQTDLYYENNNSNSQAEPYKMRLTIDFCIKTEVSKNTLSNTLKNTLAPLYLQTVEFRNASVLKNFLMLQESEKINYLSAFISGGDPGTKVYSSNQDINNYISITNPDTLDSSAQRILNIPVEVTKFFSNNLSKENKNPNFLAYVYFLTIGYTNNKSIMPDTIGTEIIFQNGNLYDRTGYFVISKIYGFEGNESELTKAPLPTNKTLIDPDTGESLNPNTPTDRNQQVNYLFGAPGDIWSGPVHLHKVNNSSARIMAGAQHDSSIPHPYLDFVIKGNNKIVDFRSSGEIEDLFSYKSSNFEKVLAANSKIVFVGQEENKTLEKNIKQNAIFSVGKFSIRPVRFKRTERSRSQATRTRDQLNFFFALDKKALLKNTTKIPMLLEAMAAYGTQDLYNQIVGDVNIFHFEIIRHNHRTKQSKSLIIGDNDSFFSDLKGFRLENVTKKIAASGLSDLNRINFYEFSDAEIDAYTDTNTYSYEIQLKFRDPLIKYLTSRLREARTMLKDLDELLQKINFMIRDKSTQRFTTVYDRYKKELNPVFVAESLNPPIHPKIPLGFEFDKSFEVPLSIKIGFSHSDDNLIENFGAFFYIVKTMANMRSAKVFQEDNQPDTLLPVGDLSHFVFSSLRLSTTNPSLIEKVRSLIDVARDRTEKLLSLYSTEQLVKKSANFTTKDYLKSTGNTKNADTYVTEFGYKFNDKINLMETKDNFNWIEEASHIGEARSIKTIGVGQYKELVREAGLRVLKSNAAATQFILPENFSYSFLPYSSPALLELQKTDKIDLKLNYLQTIRKKIIKNITNNPDSVLIPEILATFGIKFKTSVYDKMNYIEDINAYSEFKKAFNDSKNSLIDNFGSGFNQTPPKIGELPGLLIPGMTTTAPAFGSVEDPKYQWQGGARKRYPHNLALSLINLITTNVYERKDIDYLKKKHLELQGFDGINIATDQLPDSVFFQEAGMVNASGVSFNPKSIPYPINLFSTNTMSNPQNLQQYGIQGALGFFFGSDQTTLYLYHFYSYIANTFGKVFYLRGFKTRQQNAQDAIEDSFRFDQTTKFDRLFTKDMDWVPLDLNTLDNIPPGRSLLCKVDFFEGAGLNDLLDAKVIEMFKNYYSYNHIFYIKGAVGVEDVLIPRDLRDRPTESLEIETKIDLPIEEARETTNKKLQEIIDNADKSKAEKEVEDVPIEIEPGGPRKASSREIIREAVDASVEIVNGRPYEDTAPKKSQPFPPIIKPGRGSKRQ